MRIFLTFADRGEEGTSLFWLTLYVNSLYNLKTRSHCKLPRDGQLRHKKQDRSKQKQLFQKQLFLLDILTNPDSLI